ncbi:hypothetical protein Trydic_g13708 [Trypoxylus dichotomus]
MYIPCNLLDNYCYVPFVAIQTVYIADLAFVVYTFDGIFYAFLFHAYCELEKIKYGFEHLKISDTTIDDDEDVYKEFCKIVKQHVFVIRFLEDVNGMYYMQLLNHFVTITATIVFGIFFMNMDGFPPSLGQVSRYIPYLMSYHFQLYIYCTWGQEVFSQVYSVSDIIYQSKWYVKYQPKLTKGMFLVMNVSRIENKLTIGGIWKLNLATFMKIIFTALAYKFRLKHLDALFIDAERFWSLDMFDTKFQAYLQAKYYKVARYIYAYKTGCTLATWHYYLKPLFGRNVESRSIWDSLCGIENISCYMLSLVIQYYCVTNLLLNVIIFDGMFTAFLLKIFMQLRMIRYKLENLNFSEDSRITKQTLQDLVTIIIHHSFVLKTSLKNLLFFAPYLASLYTEMIIFYQGGQMLLDEEDDLKHRIKLGTVEKMQSGIVTLDWPPQSPDANPKCMGISQPQASKKKSVHFEAADTTNSSHLEVFTERIRSRLSGKYVSEMLGNYQCQW